MSTTNQTAGSSLSKDNFTAIFEAASREYERVTGESLCTHPLAMQLNGCNSSQAASSVLRTQVQAFSEFRNGDMQLMTWLDPIVRILITFSGTLGEGIGLSFSPGKAILTGIGVLLLTASDVIADYHRLICLFKRIHIFLRRLDSYTGILLTEEFIVLLGEIMAQILSILALSTKAMTERRMKKFLKRLMGKTDIADAFLRLDSLTNEEGLMALAKTLKDTHHIKRDTKEIKVLTKKIDQNMKAAKERDEEQQQDQMQKKLRTWLSPPDSSDKHNNTHKARHDGTARWLIQGSKYREWKMKGSLLWIRGNPGAGKSVLCSAIIEDIKSVRKEGSPLVTYHYFDFNDASKRHVYGLLASLLSQLSQDSNRCREVLDQLYKKCRDGSEHPSQAELADCLETMLRLPEQCPIFIIMDALDECSNATGTPSAREEVLKFVEDLIRSSHSNLFVCITSRPEQDIQTVLSPLTSESRGVALHEESGHRDDINDFVRSFVHTDREMQRWKEEDKELVINTLSERAGGMFRWTFCQLDTLRRCLPSSIRRTLDELPPTLHETYKRVLQEIPKEKKRHALWLFRCLVAAIRPLRVEELAEIFAMEFDLNTTTTNFKEDWRPENPEDAIISSCSTLITVIDVEGSKIVQFSHFSVREFLTSKLLRTSEDRNIRSFHVSLHAAHTILARACLAVLLQLNENIDKKRLATFPLAFYAAQKWVIHAQYKGVASRVQGAMDQLFNPKKPYLAAWVWIHDVDRGLVRHVKTLPSRPSNHNVTALYYAASFGFCGLAKHLISMHREDVNAKCGFYGSPLHVASKKGHLDAVSLLLDHKADVNITSKSKETPLCSAYAGRHLKVMQHLLGHGATVDMQYNSFGRLTHNASWDGQAEVLRLLLEHDCDVNGIGLLNQTPLHLASAQGYVDIVRILLDHGADVNAVSDLGTSLYHASLFGRLEVMQLLLEHGADVHIRAPGYTTPFQVVRRNGYTQIAQLLLEHGADKD